MIRILFSVKIDPKKHVRTHMCAFGEDHHHVWKTKYPRQESHLSKHGEKFIGQQWATEGQTLFHS